MKNKLKPLSFSRAEVAPLAGRLVTEASFQEAAAILAFLKRANPSFHAMVVDAMRSISDSRVSHAKRYVVVLTTTGAGYCGHLESEDSRSVTLSAARCLGGVSSMECVSLAANGVPVECLRERPSGRITLKSCDAIFDVGPEKAQSFMDAEKV